MNINPNFFKNRQKKYLHFDYPLSSEKTHLYVTNPDNVKEHAFYPFIHFNLKSQKIKKDKTKKIQENGKKDRYPIIKCEPKIREIKYSAHIDGHIYAYYAFLLSPHYEEILIQKQIQDSVLAFRKLPNSPNNIHFAKQVFDEVKERQNCSVICLDIKSFFDELDHELLKEAWKKILGVDVLPNDHYNVFKSITQYSYVEKKVVYQNLELSLNKSHKTLKRLCTSQEFREKIRGNKIISKNINKKGIPQGSSISAFLSNIYMLDFDESVNNLLHKKNARYYRYCDDILIICNPSDSNEILLALQKEIKHIKLKIQDKKTQIIKFIDGNLISKNPLQYLGFTYNGKKTLLRDSGLAKYSHKVKKAIKMTNNHLLRINTARIKRGLHPLQLHRKHLYRRFSFIGSRNYISYALRASKIMNEPSIKQQIKPHWLRVQTRLNTYEASNLEHYEFIKEYPIPALTSQVK